MVLVSFIAKVLSLYSSKLTKSLCEKYPQLQVEKAIRYAVLCSKFELKQEDFEDFENIIKLLIQSPQETKENKH